MIIKNTMDIASESNSYPSNARLLLFVFRMLTGAILLYSSSTHIGNPYQFYSAVLSYQVISEQLGLVLTSVLPFLQLTLAVCLILNVFRPTAAFVSAAMFVMFLVAQLIAIFSGMQIECGCFGGFSPQIGIGSVFELIFLIVGCSLMGVVQHYNCDDLAFEQA